MSTTPETVQNCNKQTESKLDIAHREAMEDIQAGKFTIIKDVDGHITSLEKEQGLLAWLFRVGPI